MARVLKIAAIVVAVVAVTVATAGTLAPEATAAGLAAIGITASAASVAAVLGAISTGLSLSSAMGAGKPKTLTGGNPEQFSANPDAGVPYWVGRSCPTASIQLKPASA
jgi:hypothetical protein